MSNLNTETVTSVATGTKPCSVSPPVATRLPLQERSFHHDRAEQDGGRPLLRAYSIASANYEEELEFFSIKVPDGPLTSWLQKIQPGDKFMSCKPTGTLVADHLLPGKRLLLSTGTGLAPFLSIIKDPEI